MRAPIVGIIMGSDSDLPVMREAADILAEFGVPYEMTVVSAHRTPERMVQYCKTAKKRGLKLVIAGAGGAAHLPGVAASWITMPVIGVPIQSKALSGWDSLLSIAQMPPGIPVATMAINGAKNAGLMAAAMLAVSDKTLVKKLEAYRKRMRDEVMKKAEKMEKEITKIQTIV